MKILAQWNQAGWNSITTPSLIYGIRLNTAILMVSFKAEQSPQAIVRAGFRHEKYWLD
ncbi:MULTISPECIES: hypothetical protein [unclassified Leptolyngbya]|uniref:hypothetical protein n=1 Tax=unclassified Leptolyngbya TaxID=2650499 RepID=UPI001685A8B5|nr:MULTISPECIES: hypothetical protein [unclassified Leptolyngbya]MBD1911406.1 hypothetical protein [Leptolyngbya sp. FACHB-8]MBD2159032.1 hypothetical protein [Leptolyngbya sp. FACHB-16]